MVFAEANLAAEAGVLAMSVAALTFQVLLLDHLTRGLVLELVILTKWFEAEAAGEAAPSVVPDPPLTLYTLRLPKHTGTSMLVKALFPMANPGLTEITDRPHHRHTSCVGASVLDDAVPLRHALLLPTLGTYRQTLDGLTKVAEGAVLLPPEALVALHGEVAGPLHDGQVVARAQLPDLLLPRPHLIVLLPLTRLLLRHCQA